MLLLARLSPEASGVLSDDGFVIGRFTVSATLNLLAIGTVLGVLGGGIYLVLRGLMIGPRWFQVLTISVGPAVVVGAGIVNPDRVDFTQLRPRWLAVALFVLIPGLYAVLLTIICERWLSPEGGFLRAPLPAALAPLILWLPIAPALVAGALGWLGVEALRRRSATQTLVETRWAPRLARLALTVIFASSLADLVRDVAVLT